MTTKKKGMCIAPMLSLSQKKNKYENISFSLFLRSQTKEKSKNGTLEVGGVDTIYYYHANYT